MNIDTQGLMPDIFNVTDQRIRPGSKTVVLFTGSDSAFLNVCPEPIEYNVQLTQHYLLDDNSQVVGSLLYVPVKATVDPHLVLRRPNSGTFKPKSNHQCGCVAICIDQADGIIVVPQSVKSHWLQDQDEHQRAKTG